MNTIASPSSSRRSSSRLRTCAWIETSSARDRLVGDQHLRLGGKRAGDADPLTLATGEIPRVAPCRAWRQADLVEQLAHPRLDAVARHAAVKAQHLGERIADPQASD